MKYIFTLSLMLFLTLGCKKAHTIPDDYGFMVGKYKWSYSVGYLPTEDDPDYSLIIEDSGEIYTYENGKKIYKLKISSYNNCETCIEENAVLFNTYNKKGTSISGSLVVIEDGSREMRIKGFPFDYHYEINYLYSYE